MTTFKPMLAVNSKPEDLKTEQFGSLKLEGVRAIFTPEDGLVGRSLKALNNSELYQRLDFQRIEQYCLENGIYLEGELYVHGWTFNRIDSCIRGDGNIDARQLQFYVFDCYVPSQPDAPFSQRVQFYKFAVGELQRLGLNMVLACEQTLMQSAQDITDAYVWAIEHGYEGFCLKRADGAYKHGRSTLKQELFTRIKPEETYDAVVLDIIERQHNLCESEVNELGYLKKRQDKNMKQGSGMAQTAVVYCPQIGEIHKVSLTKGLTDVDRMRIWEDSEFYKGKVMQYVGIPVPGQKVPRSPRFDKWRLDIEAVYLRHDPSDSILIDWQNEAQVYIEQGCEEITREMFIDLYRADWSLSHSK